MARGARPLALFFGLTVTMGSQPAAAPPRFEVASVKLTDSHPTNGDRYYFHESAGRIDYHFANIRGLVMTAYEMETYRVVWPAWVDEKPSWYDVSAILPADTTREQFRLMLRGLLADRFHLTHHVETRETKVLVLEVAKTGLKIHKAENPPQNYRTDHSTFALINGKTSWHFSDRAPLFPDTAPAGTTFKYLSQQITSNYLKDGRPLIDMTGLDGYYDFDLVIPRDPENAGIFPDSGILVAELQKQLGLKVEAKTIPLEMMIIDHMDRVPTEN